MWDRSHDYMIFKYFEIKKQPIKLQRVVELRFCLPEVHQILIYCDGASFANPRAAGMEFVCKGENGEFIYAESRGLGTTTNFIAEIMAIIGAAERAVENNSFDICIQSDSNATITAYTSGKIPCIVQARWQRIRMLFRRIQLVHSMREINSSADVMARKGAGLSRSFCQKFSTKPGFITSLEMPEKTYYRFY
ncbi:uncharacterized protein LOC113273233 [Papaver somniferum]|uniref:uncharacterized protein LOC113273233 n=1 Tax=Papaver somniferum TaxID=3469 RepID=UPI000E6FFDCB|nr:uncharacterized protein LOC113273233 [Papaver somniferum]